MSTKTNKKSKNAAVLGMFIALIVVLQALSFVIPPISGASLSFVLIPIVLAAVMYGTKYSTITGLSFGIIVTLISILGLDSIGYAYFVYSPIIAILLILTKGIVAGLGAGIVSSLLKKKNLYLATISTAAITPILNTAIFILGTLLFFIPALEDYFQKENIDLTIKAFLVGIILVNFVVEFIINIVLAPAILRVTKAILKK